MALHHVGSGEKVQLASGPSATDAKTMALVKTDRFEAVQLALHAGDEISGNPVPGYATFLCLAGAAILRSTETVHLDAGDWLYLARGQQYSLTAVSDTSLLLTILFD